MTIVNKLKDHLQSTKGIPSLESAANTILAAIHKGDGGIEELTELITNDISITQKVLRLVNSNMYSPFTRNITTVSSAIRVVGIKAIVHLVLSTALTSEEKIDDELAKSLLAAEISKLASSEGNYEDSTIATLLYNTGKLLCSMYLKEEMAKIDDLISKGVKPETAEVTVLGMSIKDIGVEVAKWWKLPSAIVSVLDGTGDPAIINAAKFSISASTLVYEGRADEVSRLMKEYNVPDSLKTKITEFTQQKATAIIAFKNNNAAQFPVEYNVENDDVYDSTFNKDTNPDLDGHLKFCALIFNSVKTAYKPSHCLLLSRKDSNTFTVEYGLAHDVLSPKKNFIIKLNDDPNVLQHAIVNNIDAVLMDITKLSSKSFPDFFKTTMPETKMVVILPIKTKEGINSALYFDWDEINAVPQEIVTKIKKLRDEYTKYMNK